MYDLTEYNPITALTSGVAEVWDSVSDAGVTFYTDTKTGAVRVVDTLGQSLQIATENVSSGVGDAPRIAAAGAATAAVVGVAGALALGWYLLK